MLHKAHSVDALRRLPHSPERTSTVKLPSTTWSEQIAPDEDSRFARYAAQLTAIQEQRSKKFSRGRALHRKQLLALRAEFEVLAQLPPTACQGLFKAPGRYAAHVRLSNGSMDVQADRVPDIRGFAIKVLGLNGPGALGAVTQAQDFLLINNECFGLKNSDEFMGLATSAAKGKGALVAHFLKTHGIFGGLARLKEALASIGKPFSGYATERFFSAVALTNGPYAMRIRLLPPPGQKAETDESKDWGQAMARRVKKEPLVYEFQIQFFVDEATTPIENGSINWEEADSPYVTVARLHILQQDTDSPEAKTFAATVDRSSFDPWCALAEHRPLGDIMRARKHAYFASQKQRGA